MSTFEFSAHARLVESMVGFMNDATAVRLGTADDAWHYFDAICELYDEAFSAPPFVWLETESQRHREMLNDMITKPGFGIALAEARDTLVGFVYGTTLTTSTGWWNGFQQPVSPEVTREWPGRTFAVIDLAVQGSARRHGIGHRLLDILLDSRSEQRATLAVQPQAEDTHAFYRAIGGWHLVGRQDTPAFVSPEFDIYIRELRSP
ncbi:GNAT family N-acetyltransferase [Nocardia abscessus]|uniref:GNAT family N-acetyltransferase n=1 Tax=Nocardia abscessus TaxID=120957 RepID=A0ABS0CGV3_9NOCA|nr:GNAT family N-acetyltransferase [Nocardia abscessus]MBF6229166.1 GNAT family N-acetyltransferase [Nocardia abscessus]